MSGFATRPHTWVKAGHGFSGASDRLGKAVDALCTDQSAAGACWGADDLGRAFFNGESGAPGYGAVRDRVLTELETMVNLMRATGGNLIIVGHTYALADEASTVGSALPPHAADKGVVAQEDPYRLPQVSHTLVSSNPPPTGLEWAFEMLERVADAMVGGCPYPEGNLENLGTLRDSWKTMAKALIAAADEVNGHSRTVTDNNLGKTAKQFGSFAAALHGGGEEGGLSWLAVVCLGLAGGVDTQIKKIKAGREQYCLSAVFVATTVLTGLALSAFFGPEAEGAAMVAARAEVSALKSFLLTLAKSAGVGAWFGGGLDAIAQGTRIKYGLQDGFHVGELVKATAEGGVAGAVMGTAGHWIAQAGNPFTAKLAHWMASDGLKGFGSRLGVNWATGTSGMIAAEAAFNGGHVDLSRALEAGLGMSLLGSVTHGGRGSAAKLPQERTEGPAELPGSERVPAESVDGIPNPRSDYPSVSGKGVGYDVELRPADYPTRETDPTGEPRPTTDVRPAGEPPAAGETRPEGEAQLAGETRGGGPADAPAGPAATPRTDNVSTPADTPGATPQSPVQAMLSGGGQPPIAEPRTSEPASSAGPGSGRTGSPNRVPDVPDGPATSDAASPTSDAPPGGPEGRTADTPPAGHARNETVDSGHPADLPDGALVPASSGEVGVPGHREAAVAAEQGAAALRTETGRIDEQALKEWANSLPNVPDLGVAPDVETLTSGTLSTGPGPGGLHAAIRDAVRDFGAEAVGLPAEEVHPRRVGGDGPRGASGAPVVFIDHVPESGSMQPRIAVTKIFPDMGEFAKELSALERLRSPEFTTFDVPETLRVGRIRLPNGAEAGIATFSVLSAPHTDLIQAVRDAPPHERAAAYSTLLGGTGKIAEALAELHSRTWIPDRAPAPEYSEWYVKQLTDRGEMLLQRRELFEAHRIDVDAAYAAVQEALSDLRSNPRGASVVHNDTNPGNLFYNPETGRAGLIDVATAHDSMDSAGRGIGSPAHDLGEFRVALEVFGRLFELTPAERSAVWERFERSYAEAGGPDFPPGSEAAYAMCSTILFTGTMTEAAPRTAGSVEAAQMAAALDILRSIGAQRG